MGCARRLVGLCLRHASREWIRLDGRPIRVRDAEQSKHRGSNPAYMLSRMGRVCSSACVVGMCQARGHFRLSSLAQTSAAFQSTAAPRDYEARLADRNIIATVPLAT